MTDREQANAVEEALGGKMQRCESLTHKGIKEAQVRGVGSPLATGVIDDWMRCGKPGTWKVSWRGIPYYYCGLHIRKHIRKAMNGFCDAVHVATGWVVPGLNWTYEQRLDEIKRINREHR